VAGCRLMIRGAALLGASMATLSIVFLALSGVRVAAARAGQNGSGPALDLHYHLMLLRPTTHLMEVEIDASHVSLPSLDFVLPAWAPGRYAIYNFAKNVQQFQAVGAQGQLLAWSSVDKETWRVDAKHAGGSVRVTYWVYGNDLTGSFTQFDSTHANVNGASVFMYVSGHKPDPIHLSLEIPPDWAGRAKVVDGFTLATNELNFEAVNYDRLADTPIEISPDCHITTFENHGKTFRVAVHAYNGPDADLSKPMAKLAAGLQKIVDAEMGMMPPPDFDAFTFIFHFSPYISLGDGMEHLNSTEIMIRNQLTDASVNEAIQTAAHEFFHLWNVKRLRPVGLGPFNYRSEVYTPSLWFAEGVTSYFGYWNLLRAGIWNQSDFLKQLSDEIRHFQQEPGRRLMSAESSSFYAWFYDRAPQMQETNFSNATISYYNKGALLGMLLDLEIRSHTGGRKCLANVLQYLYRECYEAPAATYYGPGRGYTEDDVLKALNAVSGSDFSSFFQKYVRGTELLPYEDVLKHAGLKLVRTIDPGAPPSLGILVQPTDFGEKIAAVIPGGAADRAGLSRDDVLIEVDGLSLASTSLADRLKMYPPGAVVPFTIERYDKRLRIPVKLDPPSAWQYSIQEDPNATPEQIKARQSWLTGQLGMGATRP
jgi:predicted metalloprotease with PDZ domain